MVGIDMKPLYGTIMLIVLTWRLKAMTIGGDIVF